MLSEKTYYLFPYIKARKRVRSNENLKYQFLLMKAEFLAFQLLNVP